MVKHRSILSDSYYGFKEPLLDTCNSFDELDVKIVSARNNQEKRVQKEVHLQKAKASQKAMRRFKEKAVEQHNDYLVIALDL